MSSLNNLNSTRANLASVGIQTAGLGFGGNPSTTASESWDGTSWTATNALPAAKGSLAGSGTQTSALAFGANLPGPLASAESWDGTNWAATASMATARGYLGGCGTSTASLDVGGSSNPAPGNIKANTEEFSIVDTLRAVDFD